MKVRYAGVTWFALTTAAVADAGAQVVSPGHKAPAARFANPDRVAAHKAMPVIVETDQATCSAQFDPTGTAKFVTACDIAKSALVTRGVSYRTRDSADGQTRVIAGPNVAAIASGEGLSGPDLKALKAKSADAINAELGDFLKRAVPLPANGHSHAMDQDRC